jgi:hypothetical protein
MYPSAKGLIMIQRIDLLATLLSVALAIAFWPDIAQMRVMQGCAVACSSPELTAVADRIAAQFDDHQFVFIGSTHGSAKAHQFLLCLLSRPAFQSRATDVLVEFANPVYQELMDRYLLKLEDVPESSLRQVWFDTDGPRLWARLPQIPEFFAAVRAINERLALAKRIRVLGGCEPVQWAGVRTAEDLAKYPFKTNWAAHVITEHIAVKPDKRLLVVYGDGHIHHKGGTLMSDVEAKVNAAQLFVVGTIRDRHRGEEERVARLGDPAKPFFVAARNFPAMQSLPGDLFYADAGSLGRSVDAVIYLGPDADRDLSNSLELSEAQRAELARREAIKRDIQLRLRHRADWFRTHPNDIPNRP